MIVYLNKKNTLAVSVRPQFYALPEGFITRDEYHLTVLDGADGKTLKAMHGLSNRVFEAWLADQAMKGIEIPGTPTKLGVGYAEQDGNAAYFEVYEWPEAQAWRRSQGLGPKDLHATIGFFGTDPQGVPKGRGSLLPNPRLRRNTGLSFEQAWRKAYKSGQALRAPDGRVLMPVVDDPTGEMQIVYPETGRLASCSEADFDDIWLVIPRPMY